MDAYVLLDPFAEIQDCLYTVSFVSIENHIFVRDKWTR